MYKCDACAPDESIIQHGVSNISSRVHANSSCNSCLYYSMCPDNNGSSKLAFFYTITLFRISITSVVDYVAIEMNGNRVFGYESLGLLLTLSFVFRATPNIKTGRGRNVLLLISAPIPLLDSLFFSFITNK